MCTIVCKYIPDFLSLVLQCKCACKVQDGLVDSIKIFKKIWEPSESFSY